MTTQLEKELDLHGEPSLLPLMEWVEQAVVVTDCEAIIVGWNRHAEELYGWKAVEVTGQPVTVVSADILRTNEILARLRHGANFAGECLVRHRDGF